MVRLYIIRHGDPDYDTNRENGGTLTAHGRKEAEALAPFLCNHAKITHAYSSPLYRARLTAQLGLQQLNDFCTVEKFNKNCGVEDWTRELSSWRAKGYFQKHRTNKEYAIWDFPPHVTRKRLDTVANGKACSSLGVETIQNSNLWTVESPDHARYLEEYNTVCKQGDDFLKRHGILKCEHSGCYKMSSVDSSNPLIRDAGIAIFCHCGFGMTWLSHLLGLPLPMVYSSFWLAPSSVTTILFDEQPKHFEQLYTASDDSDNYVYLTPRALCVGGTSHLTAAGLETQNTYYEEWKRPSGIKNNFW